MGEMRWLQGVPPISSKQGEAVSSGAIWQTMPHVCATKKIKKAIMSINLSNNNEKCLST